MVTSVDLCLEWWGRGSRGWHYSVDVPEDIAIVEAAERAEWVVALNSAKVEILSSDVSAKSKRTSERVFDSLMNYVLETVDVKLLG